MSEDLLDQWVCPDHRELLDHKVTEDPWASRVCKGRPDHKENREQRVLQENQAETGMTENPGYLEHQE